MPPSWPGSTPSSIAAKEYPQLLLRVLLAIALTLATITYLVWWRTGLMPWSLQGALSRLGVGGMGILTYVLMDNIVVWLWPTPSERLEDDGR